MIVFWKGNPAAPWSTEDTAHVVKVLSGEKKFEIDEDWFAGMPYTERTRAYQIRMRHCAELAK